MNVLQLAGTLHGTCYVPTYNWSDFFEQHTIKTALKCQYFRFKAKSPEMVYVKQKNSDIEQKIKLVKDTTWSPSANDLPDIITSPGLSLERQ